MSAVVELMAMARTVHLRLGDDGSYGRTISTAAERGEKKSQAGSIVTPAAVTSLYCSYQDIFAIRTTAMSGDYSPAHVTAR